MVPRMDSSTTILRRSTKRKRARAARCPSCGTTCPSCKAAAQAQHHKKPATATILVIADTFVRLACLFACLRISHLPLSHQTSKRQSFPTEEAARPTAGTATASTPASSSEETVTVAVKTEPVLDGRPLPSPCSAHAVRAFWIPTPLDISTVIRPASAGDKGEGQPLAPPGWQWSVGLRKVKCGTVWKDRTLTPSPEFLSKYGGRRERLRSKLQLEKYLEKFHPTLSIEVVLNSFIWNIPA